MRLSSLSFALLGSLYECSYATYLQPQQPPGRQLRQQQQRRRQQRRSPAITLSEGKKKVGGNTARTLLPSLHRLRGLRSA